ncbi:hypothetical protein I551_0181 [Mycobacterium ulcerans str. Harvey]|uniref:Secreted protein n=1 Tax=Mycobacterium ulcerans str. Harvey TaxID=1299332 RepID=A0ABN0R9A3_MYCUL|nr:hypothetical protein I551_0181 [Mycobacterium ulcerans str. Harvey]
MAFVAAALVLRRPFASPSGSCPPYRPDIWQPFFYDRDEGDPHRPKTSCPNSGNIGSHTATI